MFWSFSVVVSGGFFGGWEFFKKKKKFRVFCLLVLTQRETENLFAEDYFKGILF